MKKKLGHEIDWDAAVENDTSDLSFTFRLLGKGHHLCIASGALINEEWRLVNFEDVEHHISLASEDLSFEDAAEGMVEKAGTEDIFEIGGKLREAFCKRAVAKARAAWAGYMKDPAENSVEEDD